jgi:hypothetical protein
MTKPELIEQVKALTEEEAAEVKLIYAPDWPSKATSLEENVPPQAMLILSPR